MHVIFGNYGNNTVALMQWASEKALEEVFVVHVDTGWAAPEWLERTAAGQTFAKRCGFASVTLAPHEPFPDMIRDRGRFPSQKFQWCAGFLKGLPLLDWLDEVDQNCQATILLGSRRADSRLRKHLPEHIENSEHYGDRKVWYPLYACSTADRDTRIQRAGFEPLAHRSLECDPCIHSTAWDFQRMSDEAEQRLRALETEIGQQMFNKPVQPVKKRPKDLEPFDMGCGAPYVCGE